MDFVSIGASLRRLTTPLRVSKNPFPKLPVIFHINDTYRISAEKGQPGGVARATTLLDKMHGLRTHGGDLASPSQLSPVEMAKALGMAFSPAKPASLAKQRWGKEQPLFVVGNHEFDQGNKAFGEFVQALIQANVKVLGANIHPPSVAKKYGVLPYEIQTIKGQKVLFVGLTTRETQNGSNMEPPLYVEDPVATGVRLIPRLVKQHKPDRVVLLTHLSQKEDERLARLLPSGMVDVVLGGHDHDPMCSRVKGIPIVKAGSDAVFIVKVTLPPKTKPKVQFIPVGTNIPGDARILDRFAAGLIQDTTPIARLATGLDLRESVIRRPLGEHAALNVITDAIAKQSGIPIVLLPAGAFRSDMILPAGELTVFNAARILPFDNSVYRVSLTVRELKALLLKNIASAAGQSTAPQFIQTAAGLRRVYNPSSKTLDLFDANGSYLPDEQKIELITSSFLVGRYDLMEKAVPFLGPDGATKTPKDLWLAYLRDNQSGDITQKMDGRFSISSEPKHNFA